MPNIMLRNAQRLHQECHFIIPFQTVCLGQNGQPTLCPEARNQATGYRPFCSMLQSTMEAHNAPGAGLVPQLLELYPDAKVICTVRHPEAWVASMAGVASASTRWFLRGVLLPLPTMRHFIDYINGLRDMWLYLYGETGPPTRVTYDRHLEWLKETVPEDKLVFLAVKDGWEPLCEALGKDIPNVPFPRINDSEAIEKSAAKTTMRGLVRWSVLLVAVGVGIALYRAQ